MFEGDYDAAIFRFPQQARLTSNFVCPYQWIFVFIANSKAGIL